MANTIPNQPIVFDQDENCWLEDSGMKVLAEHGDITQFQMKLNPCGSDFNLIQNGNFLLTSGMVGSFWERNSNYWFIQDGEARKVQGLSGSFYQEAPASQGTLARLTFDIVIGQGEIQAGWSSTAVTITESGSYEFWIEAVAGTNLVLFFGDASSVATLTNVQLISVNDDFLVNIVDESGVVVDSLEKADGYFDISEGYFTCSIDWEALSIPDGCYTLEVIDPCDCAKRGINALDFKASTFVWDLESGWTIDSGSADFSSSVDALAQLYHVVCTNQRYEVTYTLSGMSVGEQFKVFLGLNGGTVRGIDGTYTDTIDAAGDDLVLSATASGASSFSVTDFSIVAVDPEPTYISNTIKVSESFNCTTLALAMCNDSDAFGFGFENTGFRPLMRIPASLNRSSYPMERLAYENSVGRKYTYYGRSRKARELGFDGLEFMHDFAHLWGMADHFYIDDTEYVVEEDEYPSISWADNDDVGGVTLIVSEKIQLIENRRLSSASVGCVPEGTSITDNNGTVIVDSEDTSLTG